MKAFQEKKFWKQILRNTVVIRLVGFLYGPVLIKSCFIWKIVSSDCPFIMYNIIIHMLFECNWHFRVSTNRKIYTHLLSHDRYIIDVTINVSMSNLTHISDSYVTGQNILKKVKVTIFFFTNICSRFNLIRCLCFRQQERLVQAHLGKSSICYLTQRTIIRTIYICMMIISFPSLMTTVTICLQLFTYFELDFV